MSQSNNNNNNNNIDDSDNNLNDNDLNDNENKESNKKSNKKSNSKSNKKSNQESNIKLDLKWKKNVLYPLLKKHTLFTTLYFGTFLFCFVAYLGVAIWYKQRCQNAINCKQKVSKSYKILFFIISAYSIISIISMIILCSKIKTIDKKLFIYIEVVAKLFWYILFPLLVWQLFPKHPSTMNTLVIIYAVSLIVFIIWELYLIFGK